MGKANALPALLSLSTPDLAFFPERNVKSQQVPNSWGGREMAEEEIAGKAEVTGPRWGKEEVGSIWVAESGTGLQEAVSRGLC